MILPGLPWSPGSLILWKSLVQKPLTPGSGDTMSVPVTMGQRANAAYKPGVLVLFGGFLFPPVQACLQSCCEASETQVMPLLFLYF